MLIVLECTQLGCELEFSENEVAVFYEISYEKLSKDVLTGSLVNHILLLLCKHMSISVKIRTRI